MLNNTKKERNFYPLGFKTFVKTNKLEKHVKFNTKNVEYMNHQ